MTDDIVTRLRKQWNGEFDPTGKMLSEAADEIERLREQIKALVHEWELSERGVHCEHKEVRDEI